MILIGYECDQSQFAYHDDNDFKAERVFWLIDWLIDEYMYIQTVTMSELTLFIELLEQTIMQKINKPIYRYIVLL